MTWAGTRSQNAAIRPPGGGSRSGCSDCRRARSWVAAVTSAGHRVEVVDVAVGERHADLAGARSAPPGTGTSRTTARRRGSRRRARRAPRRRRAGSRRSRCRPRPGPGRSRSARRCGGAAASRRGPGSGCIARPRPGRSPRPPSGAAANGDSLEASWAMPPAAIASGRLPGRHAGLVARHAGELLGEGDGHRDSILPGTAPLLGGVEIGAQLLRLAEVDVGGRVVGRARRSGAAPGSPAASSPGPGSRGSRAAAPRRGRAGAAATAGNSASRSSVVVKRQLTIASGSSSLRSISSRISSSVAPRIASASLASAWTAPRTAKSRCGSSELDRSSARHLSRAGAISARAQARACPSRERRPSAQRAEADPPQRHDPVADRLDHPPHLAVAALAQDDLDLALAEPRAPRPAPSARPRARPRSRRRAQVALARAARRSRAR